VESVIRYVSSSVGERKMYLKQRGEGNNLLMGKGKMKEKKERG